MESKQQLTVEEEAMKKKTDCIYFLASPLTCKKGNECEFRHSEVARVNPRDCWYWMSGNCLNPKCPFRHPPLDGFFEVHGTPSGQAGLHGTPSGQAGPYNNPNKQTIPCYYFQRGQCIKGDKCQFMHGSNPGTNDVSQQAPIATHQAIDNTPQDSTKVSSSFNKNSHTTSWGLKECSAIQQTINVDQPVKMMHSNSVNRVVDFPRKSASPYPLDNELPRSQPISSDSTSSSPLHYQPQLIEEHYSNGRETEDFLGESSPGFDVLVDGDEEEYARDSGYYLNEEDLGTRNPTASRTVNNFDYNPTDYDYEAVTSCEGDEYKRRMHNEYDRDYRRSIERIQNRRSEHRDSISDKNINGSDLRHSLLKKRRLNGPHGEPRYRELRHVEDRYIDYSSRRDACGYRESSLSSRLRGRITLPPHEFRGRSRGRTSPTRTNYSSMNDARRSYGARPNRRYDDMDPGSFTGPKSLAELKGANVSGSSRAFRSVVGQAHGDSLSFDGPKPLNDILKRKRVGGGDESNGNNGENFVSSTAQTVKEHDFDGEHGAMEDEELENDVDYELTANEGENFEAKDGENAYIDDEEDEDEFAKKVGGFFS